MKDKIILGVMSGTSLDGLDFALCKWVNSNGGGVTNIWILINPGKRLVEAEVIGFVVMRTCADRRTCTHKPSPGNECDSSRQIRPAVKRSHDINPEVTCTREE